MLDVNMMVEKLRAIIKFFETDTQTFSKGHIRYQESILRHFRAKKKFIQKYPEMDRPNLRCLLQLC
jgi:hypothetical protein